MDRKNMTEADGRALLELWRASGHGPKQFCAERGLSLHRFKYWRKRVAKLDAQAAEENDGGFVELSIEPRSSSVLPPTLVVAPTGWRVETSAPISEVLRAVINAC